jgi:protein-tyrosine kinase
MSANVEILKEPEVLGELAPETAPPQVAILEEINNWDREDFARDQIRALVRRVFFASDSRAVRQVVFSAAEPNRDLADICNRVGEALALETAADIAIVGRKSSGCASNESAPNEIEITQGPRIVGSAAIKSWSIQTAPNLWRVPELEVRECHEGPRGGRYWLSCLAELRNEFDYAVIQGPSAGISSEAALLGELADGIILVLGANSTRRAIARKIKNTWEGAGSRILGTVLSDRTFPIPERIYRRL